MALGHGSEKLTDKVYIGKKEKILDCSSYMKVITDSIDEMKEEKIYTISEDYFKNVLLF